MELEPGMVINPVDLCNQALINEFLASERFGMQGASATGYERNQQIPNRACR